MVGFRPSGHPPNRVPKQIRPKKEALMLQTSVRVRQLTPEELRARGTVDGRNSAVDVIFSS